MDASRLSLSMLSGQFIKYVSIGLLSNFIGYCVYLLATFLGGTPKLTMTALYIIGALISFFANRKITFQHDGHIGAAGVRYLVAHLLAYLLNLALLMLFVDWLGIAHQIVQFAAIFVVGSFLFLVSRFFVFAPDKSSRNTKML